ncbi:MAG: PqqD family protein [Candidatus Poseidoniales archaeon]|nr:PqqD family protein [Candidatus Poseidoniales archaeon]
MWNHFDDFIALCDIHNGGIVIIEGDWSNFIPVRLPVEWEFRGDAGIHPEIEGITGKEVVLLIEKRFSKFERFLAKILKAPKIVKRPMHHTQSMLWELMDGERTFSEICEIMESLYHEDIAPVEERIKAYLEVFVRLNVATVFKHREEE